MLGYDYEIINIFIIISYKFIGRREVFVLVY